jgi:hypothetical protein
MIRSTQNLAFCFTGSCEKTNCRFKDHRILRSNLTPHRNAPVDFDLFAETRPKLALPC